jgi:hypothetical protein
MTKIFPFDRQTAASRLRAESKRVARERQRTEEAAIWASLVKEQIDVDRRKKAKPLLKPHRPRTEATPVDPLKRVTEEIWACAEGTIKSLMNDRAVFHDNRGREMPRAFALAHCRLEGFWIHPLYATRTRLWLRRILGPDRRPDDEEKTLITATVLAARTVVRRSVRDILRNSSPELRAQTLLYLRRMRVTSREDRQLGHFDEKDVEHLLYGARQIKREFENTGS